MHTFSETGAGVPAFLAKLWRLVDDPDTNNLICWSKDGRSFIIQNQAQFARELLPLNYKHNNMASFIRQLNMYGFHKITSIENGGLKFDRDEMEFSHPCFKRNCPYLLEHIKRKIANTKSLDEKTAVKPEAVSKVLQDVKVMRGRQDSLDSRFSVMKQENEALWREIASLRQKHAKQQQIVNKLIQFLITIVQPSRNMTSVKRHMQLMINDTPENAKFRQNSESESECQGPVIHELGEELLDEVEDADLIDANSPYINLAAQHIDPNDMERPQSNASLHSQQYDYSNQSVEDVLGSVVMTPASLQNNGNIAAEIINPATPSMDGQPIVYHVTEVPDAQASENQPAMPPNYIEDHLTTPMVRQEMARSQLLKQKNKQRRRQQDNATVVGASTSAAAAAASTAVASSPLRPSKVQRISKQNITTSPIPSATTTTARIGDQEIQIKAEPEHDSMMYLNVYPDGNVMLSDAPLNSPNLSNDSCSQQQQVLAAGAGSMAALNNAAPSPLSQDNSAMLMAGNNSNSNLYNANQFIATDMPADLFDDNSMMMDDNTNKHTNQSQAQQQQQQIQQQQQQQQQLLGQLSANNGKFSSYIVGNNNNNNNSNGNNLSNSASTSSAAGSGNNNGGAAMTTLAKYNRTTSSGDPVSRDDVHGHLETVQDELDTLKDLLRGDNYSLDANTLLGDYNNSATTTATTNLRNGINLSSALEADWLLKLFSDSDILGPYGLSMSGDNSNDKKGSELMAYQPIYDLSDIMDINNKDELEEANNVNLNAPSSSRQLRQQNSVLNTPQHQ